MQTQIVLVEDDPIGNLYLTSALQDYSNLVVSSFHSGEEALEFSSANSIKIAILDVGLPGIDGIETGRRLKEQQDLAIIYLTGNTEKNTIARAQETEPFSFLSKPVDVVVMKDLINQIINSSYEFFLQDVQPGFLLDTLYDSAAIGMCVTDENRRFVRVNRAYRNTYGYSAQELLGNEFTMVLPENAREYGAKMHDDFIYEVIKELPGEWQVQRKDGEVRDVFVTAGRMKGTDGKVYKVTTVTDVTEQKINQRKIKSALEEKEILLRELNHRVKNNLNMLNGMIQMEISNPTLNDEGRKTLQSLINRVKALGVVYEKLQVAEARSEISSTDLVSGLLDGFENFKEKGSFSIQREIESVPLDIDFGISVGLIVNELLTNSIKHGQSGSNDFVIRVSLRVENQNRLIIEVEDNGPGLNAGFNLEETNSLGLQIIQAISARFKGGVRVQNHSTAHFRVELLMEEKKN